MSNHSPDFDDCIFSLHSNDATTTPFDLSGAAQMTLYLRLRDPSGQWQGSLLSCGDPDDRWSDILWAGPIDTQHLGFREKRRLTGDRGLHYRWRTSPLAERSIPSYMRDDPTGWFEFLGRDPDNRRRLLDGVLELDVPVDLIGADGWHDVIVRYRGHVVELFVNGVLVDEEWPHGTLRCFASPLRIGAGFTGEIERLAVWDKALDDQRVARLSGTNHEIEILSGDPPSPQYWRPPGHNVHVGDCMIFCHEDRLHVYYLYDRRHHQSKWAMGAHQFAHLSSNDLIHWQRHPMALSITDPTECALGTGCFVHHNGLFHLFYIEHAKRGLFIDARHHADNIFLATSRDGEIYEKHPEPVVKLDYAQFGDINPHVIRCADGSGFLMTNSGRSIFHSTDLKHWRPTQRGQSLQQARWVCTTDFFWNGWHYITGQGKYLMSRTPVEDAQWIEPPYQGLQDGWGVPVVSQFREERYIIVGFARGERNALGKPRYANEMIFRELVQHADGTLSMKWPAELIPATGDALSLKIGTGAGNAALIEQLPFNYLLEATMVPDSGVNGYRLILRTNGMDGGCELCFDPAEKRVRFADADGFVLEAVEGLDRPLRIQVVVKDDLIDVCLNDRRTLLHRHTARGDGLLLSAADGRVHFEALTVRPLLTTDTGVC